MKQFINIYIISQIPTIYNKMNKGSTEVLPISQSLFTYSPIAFLNFFHTFSFIIGAGQCFPLTSK